MNDFTKEELEKLRDGLNYAVGNPYGFTADSIYPLYDKIKSLIENYCEHESDEHCYYPDGIKCTDFLTYACSESPCFLKCKKCKELYK